MKTSPYLEKLEDLTKKIPDVPFFLQHMFTQSHDMLAVSDKDGKFVWVNSFTEKLLGYSRKELLTMPWENMVHPDDMNKTMVEFSKLKDEKDYKTHCFSNRYLRKDGTVVPLCWNTTGFIDGFCYCIARHCELGLKESCD